MDLEIFDKNKTKKDKVTTVKLSLSTKSRIDNLRLHHRESYDEIMQRILEILNLCRANPIKAREHLILIDKQRKEIMSRKIGKNTN